MAGQAPGLTAARRKREMKLIRNALVLTGIAAGLIATVPAQAFTVPHHHRIGPATAGQDPVNNRHRAASLNVYLQNYPGLPDGDGWLWDDNGLVKSSHTYKTEWAVSALNNNDTTTTVTQMIDQATGRCTGAVNHSGTWLVQDLTATQCSGDVPRSQWIEWGYEDPAGPYGFENSYMLQGTFCPSGDGNSVQVNGAGKEVTDVCTGIGFPNNELFIPVTP